MAVVNLDSAPAWFIHQAKDHMTADEARQMAGTTGQTSSGVLIAAPCRLHSCHA